MEEYCVFKKIKLVYNFLFFRLFSFRKTNNSKNGKPINMIKIR